MVQALIEIDENTNRVLNIVKAQYELKDKGEAIAFVVGDYVEKHNEPALKPSFIKTIEKIKKQKGIRVKNFTKRYKITDAEIIEIGKKIKAGIAKRHKV